MSNLDFQYGQSYSSKNSTKEILSDRFQKAAYAILIKQPCQKKMVLIGNPPSPTLLTLGNSLQIIGECTNAESLIFNNLEQTKEMDGQLFESLSNPTTTFISILLATSIFSHLTVYKTIQEIIKSSVSTKLKAKFHFHQCLLEKYAKYLTIDKKLLINKLKTPSSYQHVTNLSSKATTKK